MRSMFRAGDIRWQTTAIEPVRRFRSFNLSSASYTVNIYAPDNGLHLLESNRKSQASAYCRPSTVPGQSARRPAPKYLISATNTKADNCQIAVKLKCFGATRPH